MAHPAASGRTQSERLGGWWDAVRDRLNEMGIVLEDGPQGTTWRRK